MLIFQCGHIIIGENKAFIQKKKTPTKGKHIFVLSFCNLPFLFLHIIILIIEVNLCWFVYSLFVCFLFDVQVFVFMVPLYLYVIDFLFSSMVIYLDMVRIHT